MPNSVWPICHVKHNFPQAKMSEDGDKITGAEHLPVLFINVKCVDIFFFSKLFCLFLGKQCWTWGIHGEALSRDWLRTTGEPSLSLSAFTLNIIVAIYRMQYALGCGVRWWNTWLCHHLINDIFWWSKHNSMVVHCDHFSNLTQGIFMHLTKDPSMHST